MKNVAAAAAFGGTDPQLGLLNRLLAAHLAVGEETSEGDWSIEDQPRYRMRETICCFWSIILLVLTKSYG